MTPKPRRGLWFTRYGATKGAGLGRFRDRLVARDIRKTKLAHIAHHKFEDVRILPPPKRNDIIAFIPARNERLRLPDCLNHHRNLGVDRFVVLDNGSGDGSIDFLLTQPDVDIISTENSYAEAYSATFWHERIVARYGFDRWYLILDADELLVYDGAPHRSLHDLADHLTKWGCKSLYTPMIDMYSDRPFDQVDYEGGHSMLAACPYFDGTSYTKVIEGFGVFKISGGPRRRLLGEGGKVFKHAITKRAFFFWDRTLWRKSIHTLFIPGDENIGQSGALLHFKFLGDFADRVASAIAEKQHWRAAKEYEIYAAALKKGGLQTLMYEGSTRYVGPRSLLDCDLMERVFWDHKRPTSSLFSAAITGRPLKSALNEFRT